MAIGHAYRTNRSNTRPHRPDLAERHFTLANGEPSTHGAKRTFRDAELGFPVIVKVGNTLAGSPSACHCTLCCDPV